MQCTKLYTTLVDLRGRPLVRLVNWMEQYLRGRNVSERAGLDRTRQGRSAGTGTDFYALTTPLEKLKEGAINRQKASLNICNWCTIYRNKIQTSLLLLCSGTIKFFYILLVVLHKVLASTFPKLDEFGKGWWQLQEWLATLHYSSSLCFIFKLKQTTIVSQNVNSSILQEII